MMMVVARTDGQDWRSDHHTRAKASMSARWPTGGGGKSAAGNETGMADWRRGGEDNEGGTGGGEVMSNDNAHLGKEGEDGRAWGEAANGNTVSTKQT